ncbi:MAG: CNNM domain-containing protein [Phycisphaerae bacterium]|jgi:CBS domain containing-hemolysin-like protein|nr:CNNM domain-containing protein [Phycisphaerae bacterium]
MIVATSEISVWGGWVLAALCGLIMCAVYCGLETGIYVLNKVRLDLHAEGNHRPAGRLKAMLANPNNTLAVLLIGTNIAAYMATFAVSAMFLLAGAGHQTEWWTIATATPLLFILGESVPKNVFQRASESLIYRLTWVLRISSILFNAVGLAPLVRGFAWLCLKVLPGQSTQQTSGRQYLLTIVADSAASGVLTHNQTVMADRVMHIGQITLDQVMTPIARVQTVGAAVTREELLASLAGHNFSRLPVVNSDKAIVGVINIYDVLLDESIAQPAEVMTAPPELPSATTVTEALYQMKKANAVMAAVTDNSGRHAGIVTIKDLVEEIVGDLAVW